MFLKKKEIKTASLQREIQKKMMVWMGDGGDGSEPFSCQLKSYHLRTGCSGWSEPQKL